MSVSYPFKKIKTLCSVIYVKRGFILNAIILILLITKSFITKLNNGIIFVATVQYDSNMNHSISVEKNIECLVLNPPQNLSLLLNQFNSLSDKTDLHDDDDDDDDDDEDDDNDIDLINNCKHFYVEQVPILKILKKSLKMFHINACS